MQDAVSQATKLIVHKGPHIWSLDTSPFLEHLYLKSVFTTTTIPSVIDKMSLSHIADHPNLSNLTGPYDWDFSKDDGTKDFTRPIVLDASVTPSRSVEDARLSEHIHVALALNECGIQTGTGKVFWVTSNSTRRDRMDAGTVTLLYRSEVWIPSEIEILNNLPNQRARAEYFQADARLRPNDMVLPLVQYFSHKCTEQTGQHWPMSLENPSALKKTWIIYLSGIHRILVALDSEIKPALSQTSHDGLALTDAHLNGFYTCEDNTALMQHLDDVWFNKEPCPMVWYRDVIMDQAHRVGDKAGVADRMAEYQNNPQHLAAWFEKTF